MMRQSNSSRKYTGPVAGLATRRFLCCLGLCCLDKPPQAEITRAADLPVFTYKIDGTVEDVLQSDQKFRQLAARFVRIVDRCFAKYDIEDKGTLRGLLSTLADARRARRSRRRRRESCSTR